MPPPLVEPAPGPTMRSDIAAHAVPVISSFGQNPPTWFDPIARFVGQRNGRVGSPIPVRALGSRPMIRLRGRLRSTMIGPMSVVSAEPWWPTESTASTLRWNRGGTVAGTVQTYWPALSCAFGDRLPVAPG